MVQKQGPFWLMLFGLAALGAGVTGLLNGGVATPSSFGLSGMIERASQPEAYWLLTVVYIVAGVAFLLLAWQRRGEPAFGAQPAQPPASSPRWARVLAWLGVGCGALLIAAAVMFHFTLGPIISLMFVAIFGGGGLLIGFVSVGYLVTGRAS